MPCRSRPCIFAPQARLQATPPGAAACARLARPISTSPTRQRCSYGAAAAWCRLDSSPRGDSAGCNCSPSQTYIALLRAPGRPPDAPRICRLGSGQLPIRETGSAVNQAPHTSTSGPSAGIGTTLGTINGAVTRAGSLRLCDEACRPALTFWYVRSTPFINSMKA